MRLIILFLLLGYGACSNATAEVVETANGERLIGKVVSLDTKKLQLESESFGLITIDRSNVATIWLIGSPKTYRNATVSDDAKASPSEKLSTAFRNVQTSGEVLNLLRKSGGVDADTMSQLKKQFPMLETPEVKLYFTDKVGGLMTGRLSVQDIRKDAVKAVDQINEIKKDLGPQAAGALDGYLSILENFIERSAPEDGQQTKRDATEPADTVK